MIFINVLISSCLISLAVFLSKKYPASAGFVVGALPLSTLITLAFVQLEGGDTQRTVIIARSVFFAVLCSLVFFVPYFILAKFKLNFWVMWTLSIVLVLITYPLHKKLVDLIK